LTVVWPDRAPIVRVMYVAVIPTVDPIRIMTNSQ